MNRIPAWQYDECRHVGVDYADPQVAEEYDARHQRFRGDLAAEADRLLDALGVRAGHSLLDVGCGSGNLAIQAARRGVIAYGVDVSPAMLAVARRKADAAGVTGATFRQGGFLTYTHDGPPADVLVSMAALRHLPDFWKLVGLRRLAGMLRDDGLCYLMDTVYSFPPPDYARFMAETVARFARNAGEEFGQEVATAFREEFSTCDWIMEGVLTRAGFVIERAEYPDGMLARYWCRKARPAQGGSA
ncbi:MAG TPA: class I SAM-dependent methyltransferase [Armatimonadota bacterium]|nr:class I SAM-dependent methyltransferase [Armatimonadota bacterium]